MAKRSSGGDVARSTTNRTPESKQLMEDILIAATQLFSEKGYLGTTTQELADRVGLVKGTLYYHIGSKDDLLYRIHDQVTDEGISRWRAIIDKYGDRDSAELLRLLIVEHCLVIDEYRDWVAVFSEEIKYLPSELRAKVRVKRTEYQGIFEDVVRRGVSRGELTTSDPHLTSLVALGMMNAMYRWYQPGGRMSPRRIGELMTHVILDGIYAG
jgi:TetR/AcrR family transcriptional regulator, cholesterol catabolism regulator